MVPRDVYNHICGNALVCTHATYEAPSPNAVLDSQSWKTILQTQRGPNATRGKVNQLQQNADLLPATIDWCQHVMQAHGRTGGTAQEWVRGMLGCVGRGGNAQAIRDEILHIMHRHHIGEKRGTWMEVTSKIVQQHL